MLFIRSFQLVFLSVFVLGLAACGGADGDTGGLSGGHDDFDDDPAEQVFTVTITNDANFTDIDEIWIYEAFTGQLYLFNNDSDLDLPPGWSQPIVLQGSQYDFYVYYSDGHRSDDAVSIMTDPYNGSTVTLGQPRVHAGHDAQVIFSY